MIQSGQVKRGFVPTVSDPKKASLGAIVIACNQERIYEEPYRREGVFWIGWNGPGKYKKQSFVVMEGMKKEENIAWIPKVLLLIS